MTAESGLRLAADLRTRFEFEALGRSRVVAVLRAPRYQRTAQVVRVLAGHGISAVEIGLVGQNALAAIEAARSVPGVVVGAGMVTTAAQTRAAVAAGADFLVAPLGAREAIEAAGSTPVTLIGYTLNEVWAAWQASGVPVEVFPAASGGPAYLSTLAGQLPQVPLLPAGGIALDRVGDYLAAGALAVVVGTALCPPDALVAGDVDTIAARASSLSRGKAYRGVARGR